MTEERTRCGTCLYAQPNPVDGHFGEDPLICHRYPPNGPIIVGFTGSWPQVLRTDWCGEWKFRPDGRCRHWLRTDTPYGLVRCTLPDNHTGNGHDAREEDHTWGWPTGHSRETII